MRKDERKRTGAMEEARESRSTERKAIKTRAAWLRNRRQGIGASEAAAIVGLSPWMTTTELWELKTGRKTETDKSDDEFISQGIRLEPALREVFQAIHPEYKVEYHQYDMLCQSDRPWLFATLDGEITDDYLRKGVLEIKTATPNGKAGWDKWNNQIPDYYFVQTLHQLLATGYDFVIVYAALFSNEGNVFLREYTIDRSDYEEDMAWLLGKEEAFWKSVEGKSAPPLLITF